MKAVAYILACLLAAAVPLWHDDSPVCREVARAQFPVTFDGATLVAQEMPLAERAFYADFPGATGCFALDGRAGESLFLRYTETPTRLLHSADGCYRASGYALEFTDNTLLQVDELADHPIAWSQFRITEAEGRFLIRQCVVSLSTDRSYADVPAWYWQTMFSSDDPGPWLAITWKLPDELGGRP